MQTFPFEEALQKTAQHYFATIHSINNRPRHAAKKKALTALRRKTERLWQAMQAYRAAVEELDDASRWIWCSRLSPQWTGSCNGSA